MFPSFHHSFFLHSFFFSFILFTFIFSFNFLAFLNGFSLFFHSFWMYVSLCTSHPLTHTHTHSHTITHASKHTHTHKHTNTNAHMQTQTHTNPTHTHTKTGTYPELWRSRNHHEAITLKRVINISRVMLNLHWCHVYPVAMTTANRKGL